MENPITKYYGWIDENWDEEEENGTVIHHKGWACFVEAFNTAVEVRSEDGEVECWGMSCLESAFSMGRSMQGFSEDIPDGVKKATMVILSQVFDIDSKYNIYWNGGTMQRTQGMHIRDEDFKHNPKLFKERMLNGFYDKIIEGTAVYENRAKSGYYDKLAEDFDKQYGHN